MTPFDLLVAIEAAYAKPRGRHGVILELQAPSVFGIRGRYVREETADIDGQTIRWSVYGYTRQQCRKMERLVHEAARADMEGR